MSLDAGSYHLTCGYAERAEPEYFVDDETSGVTWQPDVYPEVLALARTHGRDVVIDLGCGRAGKLISLIDQHPGLKVVGVDYGSNIDWCRETYTLGHWVWADLESASTLPLASETIKRAVLVCSDVLEHLIDPRPAMRLICLLLKTGAARAVLSTPARDKRAGAAHLGPPLNPSHVREWTCQEFRAFVESFPVSVERFGLTRSDDTGGGLTTQLVVLKTRAE